MAEWITCAECGEEYDVLRCKKCDTPWPQLTWTTARPTEPGLYAIYHPGSDSAEVYRIEMHERLLGFSLAQAGKIVFLERCAPDLLWLRLPDPPPEERDPYSEMCPRCNQSRSICMGHP